MAHPILMPKPGQMTEECVLTLWRKEVGEPVHRGDVLFEIETDKSSMEVETFDEGVLLAKLVQDGETAPGQRRVRLDRRGGRGGPRGAGGSRPGCRVGAGRGCPGGRRCRECRGHRAGVAPSPRLISQPRPPARAQAAPSAAGGKIKISPRASRLAAQAGIDPLTVTGTGPDGRIVERDIAAAVDARSAAPAPAATPAPAPITAATAAPAAPVAPMPVAPVEGEEAPRPMSRMRRTIAARLTNSWQTTPHFTVTVAVDVTRVLALRAELKAEGHSLTVTDFVLAATAQTLAEFPDVNSRTDGEVVYPRRRVHLGVAVSVPSGLVVPVVRDADRITIVALHDRVAALAAAAREGTIAVDDLTGSTFTVSNLGMYGVEEFSAIINPGEAAILAVSSAVATPVAIDGGIGIRQIMKLTLSADHRLVDGEMGARFLNALRRRLEDVRAFRDEVANA